MSLAVGVMIIASTMQVIADVVVLNGSFEATTLALGNNYTVGSDIAGVPDWTFSESASQVCGLATVGTSPGNTGGLQAFSPFPDGSNNAAFVYGQGTFSPNDQRLYRRGELRDQLLRQWAPQSRLDRRRSR